MEAVVEAVIGVDAHLRTHTLAAADELGRELASKTLRATRTGTSRRWPGRRGGLAGAGD